MIDGKLRATFLRSYVIAAKQQQSSGRNVAIPLFYRKWSSSGK
jgi:hypothetical protein